MYSTHTHTVTVYCLQETKIKKRTLSEFDSFGKRIKMEILSSIANDERNNIHRHWKVSDRISILGNKTKNEKEYACITRVRLKLKVTEKYFFFFTLKIKWTPRTTNQTLNDDIQSIKLKFYNSFFTIKSLKKLEIPKHFLS